MNSLPIRQVAQGDGDKSGEEDQENRSHHKKMTTKRRTAYKDPNPDGLSAKQRSRIVSKATISSSEGSESDRDKSKDERDGSDSDGPTAYNRSERKKIQYNTTNKSTADHDDSAKLATTISQPPPPNRRWPCVLLVRRLAESCRDKFVEKDQANRSCYKRRIKENQRTYKKLLQDGLSAKQRSRVVSKATISSSEGSGSDKEKSKDERNSSDSDGPAGDDHSEKQKMETIENAKQ